MLSDTLPSDTEILHISAPYRTPTNPEEVRDLSLPNSYMPRILELTKEKRAATPDSTIEEILFEVLSTFGFGADLELMRRSLTQKLNDTPIGKIRAMALKAVFPTVVDSLTKISASPMARSTEPTEQRVAMM